MKKRTLTLVLMLVVSLVSLVGLTACEVDTHEHTMQKTEAMAATCTEAGNIEYYTCTDCGKLFADEKGETEITAESTVVAANGHTIVAVNAKEATCTEAGNTAHYKCSVCGKLFSDENGTTEITAENTVVAAKGHEMTHHEVVPATCTEDGTLEHYSCSVCEKNFADENGTAELTSVVDTKKGHEMTRHEAVSATCTEDGNKEYYSCSRCNKNFADENGTTELTEIVISAKGHAYTLVPEIPKTCTTDGTKAHYICNNEGCGKKFILEGEEYKPATDLDLIIDFSHETEKVEAKTETCTENGNTAYYACSACGKYFSDEDGNNEIEANSWVIPAHHTFEETLSNDETNHWYACKNCDAKKDETAHTYGDATFNAIGGSGTHTCTACEYEEEITDSNPNPDFTKNKYGAVAMWQKEGEFTEHQGAVKSANDGGGVTANNALEYVVAGNNIYEDYLPKINFAAFTRVSLKVVFNNYQWNWQVGLSSDKLGNISDGYIAAGNYEGTMTFIWQQGKLVQTLTINGKSFTKTITDEQVFNGNASANLICLGSIGDRRTIHVSDFTFGIPCETHTYGEATSWAIGKTVQTCSVCGYENYQNAEVGELDFTANKLGAKATWQVKGAFTLHSGATQSSTELAVSDGAITKDSLAYIAAASRLYEDYLPRINFAAFKKVTITFSVQAANNVWKLGLSADSVVQITNKDGTTTGEATLTFEMQGDKLVQTLTVNGATYTKEITNSSVINGEESATFYVQDATGRGVFYLSDFTFEK